MNTKLFSLLLLGITLIALPLTALADDVSGSEPKTATLSGKVIFDGEKIPVLKILDMSGKPEHAEHCAKASDNKDRSYLVDSATKGIANVFVEIRKVTKEKWEAPDANFHVDQSSCRFEPHVTVVAAKTKVKFMNSDPFMHNVNLVCKKNTSGNYGIPEKGIKEIEFKYSEKIGVRCDVHTWMSAWIVVTDNPFHYLTGSDGSFSIAGVPEGTYEIRFWHETLGTLKKKKVEVTGATVLEIKSSDGAWK